MENLKENQSAEQYIKKLVDDVVQAKNPYDHLQAMERINQTLSKNTSSVDEFLKCGIIPILANCLSSPYEDLQLGSLKIITIITAGTHEDTKKIVESGIVRLLIGSLASEHGNICEQSLLALGNVINDHPEFRNLTISEGIIPCLVAFAMNPGASQNLLQIVSFVIASLCQNADPKPLISDLRRLVPVIERLTQAQDIKIMKEITRAITFLTGGGMMLIDLIIESSVVPHLFPLLSHFNDEIVQNSWRAIGNIASGTAEQTQFVIDSGILQHIQKAMKDPKEIIRAMAMWLLSNITAGVPSQVQTVFDAEFIPTIVEHLLSDEISVKKEAAYAICNVAEKGTIEQIQELLRAGVLPPLYQILDFDISPGLQKVITEGIATLQKALDVSHEVP